MKLIVIIGLFLLPTLINAQVIQGFADTNAQSGSIQVNTGKTTTDTIFIHDFYGIPGLPAIVSYAFSNGNGHFFGTNFIDIDQNAATPYEPGSPACAQGYKFSGSGYHIDKLLVRVGYKYRTSTLGSPLVLSVHKLDGESAYSVNTPTGTQSYTIDAPGTGLGSAAIPYDSIKTGAGINYSIATLSPPVWIEEDYCVVADFTDFYLNGDRIGLYGSSVNGANIYGQEYTLWHYPSPFLWLQVTHVYSSVTRAIAIFPVIDDGTANLEEAAEINGVRLSQNFPNPAKGLTTIEFELTTPAPTTIYLLDAEGRTVLQVEKGMLSAGRHSVDIDLTGFAPGSYYYLLDAGSMRAAKNLIIAR